MFPVVYSQLKENLQYKQTKLVHNHRSYKIISQNYLLIIEPIESFNYLINMSKKELTGLKN